MNKMVFAFDEARAKRDGVEPAALWAMVDGWIDKCVKSHHGEYKKAADPEGGIAYIGLGCDVNWVTAFMEIVIFGQSSECLAKYCSKWEWYYDEDEGECFEDALAYQFTWNDLYQRADRT